MTFFTMFMKFQTHRFVCKLRSDRSIDYCDLKPSLQVQFTNSELVNVSFVMNSEFYICLVQSY